MASVVQSLLTQRSIAELLEEIGVSLELVGEASVAESKELPIVLEKALLCPVPSTAVSAGKIGVLREQEEEA